MPIQTKAPLQSINNVLVVHIPHETSEKFPSRSQLYLTGTFSGVPFSTIAEPDGQGSHWFTPADSLLKSANIVLGDMVVLELESSKQWPEPELPNDFASMLQDPVAKSTWDKATPMAHWEWLRWVNSTTNPETRTKRIEVSRSKLSRGMRRPCCFNRNMCCVPEVSKSGVLLAALR